MPQRDTAWSRYSATIGCIIRYEQRKLVEPALPHDPIGIIHLTSVRKATIGTTDHSSIDVLLTYSGIKAMSEAQHSPAFMLAGVDIDRNISPLLSK